MKLIGHFKLPPCCASGFSYVLCFVVWQVEAKGAGKGELVVEARAPSGRMMKCPVSEHNGSYSAKFQPDEIGKACKL